MRSLSLSLVTAILLAAAAQGQSKGVIPGIRNHPADLPPPVVTPPPTPTPTPPPVVTPPTPSLPPEPDHPVTYLYVPTSEVIQEAITGTPSVVSGPISIIFYGDGLAWAAFAKTDNGGDWLAVSKTQGYDDYDLHLLMNTANLKAGVYTGYITVLAAQSVNGLARFKVTLRVRDPIPSTLRVSASQITFTAREDGADPTPQKLTLKMEGETLPDWQAATVSLNGGKWLTAAPAAGKGSGEIAVSANLGGLQAGVYAGRIEITAPNANNPSLQVPVSLTVTRLKASLSQGGIVNTATNESGPIAPGQLVSLYGLRLGPATPQSGKLSESGKFAASLGGTTVSFDSVAAPILYVSSTQVNVQAPFEVAGKRQVKVTVESAGYDASDGVTLAVAESAPGIFSLDGRRAAAINQDGSFNSPETPAPAGSVVQFFVTGQGSVTPRLESGALAPTTAPFAQPDLAVALFVNGQRANLQFAGLAPGAIGLLQVNAEIPATTSPGDAVAVGLRIGTISAPNTLTISVSASAPAQSGTAESPAPL